MTYMFRINSIMVSRINHSGTACKSGGRLEGRVAARKGGWVRGHVNASTGEERPDLVAQLLLDVGDDVATGVLVDKGVACAHTLE